VTTSTFFAATNDGELFSLSSVYVTMQAGAGFSTTTTATTHRGGQGKSGPNFQGFQFFMDFDTSSIPDTDEISAVTLSLRGEVDQSATDFVSEVYVFDWDTTVTTADWRTPTQIGSLTRVATHNSSGFSGAYLAFTSDAAFLTAINKTGSTRLMVTSDRFRASTEPTALEYIVWASGNASTREPKLVVEHAAGAEAQNVAMDLVTNAPTVFSPAVVFPLNETFTGASGAPNAWWTTSVVGTGVVELDTDRLEMSVPAQNDVGQALLNLDVIPADVDLRADYTYTVLPAQTVGFNFRGDGVWQSSGNRHLFTNGLAIVPVINVSEVRLYSTVASVSSQLGASLSLVIGATDTVHMHVVTSGANVYWRAWLNADLEPTVWQTATDSNHAARKRLGLGLQNPFTSSPVIGYWDNVTANSVPTGPTSPVLPLVTNTFTVFSPTVTLSTNSFAEDWTGTDSTPWPAQWTTQAAGTGAVADIQSDKGRMATGTTAFGKVGARNSAAYLYSDYTLTVDITVPVYTEWYFFIHVRGANAFSNTYKLPSSYQIRFTQSAGAVVCELYQVDASGVESAVLATGTVSGTPIAGDTIRIAIEVAGTSTITLKQKAWKVGTAEPAYTDLSGGVSVAHNGSRFALSVQGGNNTTSEDFLWDDFTVIASAQTAVLPVVTHTQTVFGPTVTRGSVSTVLPLVTNAFTVFSPTITTGAKTAVLPLVTNTMSVFSVVVTRSAVTAVLPLITATPTVFSPSARPVQTITTPTVYARTTGALLDENGIAILDEAGDPIFIEGASGVFDPSAALGTAVATLPLVTNTLTVFSPRVTADTQTITVPMVYARTTGVLLDSRGLAILDSNGLPLLDGIYGMFTPTVTLGAAVATLPLVTGTPTVFSPTVRGAQTAVLPLVTNAFTVFTPGLMSTRIELPMVENTSTVFAPTVIPTFLPVLPLVTATPTVFSPGIGFSVVMELVTAPSEVFAPGLSSTKAITPELVINVAIVFAPSVAERFYTFVPPIDQNGPRKLPEHARRRAGVSRMANDLAGFYGTSRSMSVLKIDGVYRTIEGPDMDQINAASEYYAGGHVHEVTAQVAELLEAAGYEVQGYP